MTQEAAIPPCPAPERLRKVLAGTARPYLVLKAGITLDGKMATRTGASRWITGPAARAHAHALRGACDAVLVGIGTVSADDPRLTARLPGVPNPIRVVVDSQARIAPTALCLAPDGTRRLVVVGSGAPAAPLDALRSLGVEVLICGTPRPQPGEYLPRLRTAGVHSILVEGGAKIHASLIAHGAVDELFLYMAGSIFGDPEAPGWCAALGVDTPEGAPRVTLNAATRLEPDMLIHGFFDV